MLMSVRAVQNLMKADATCSYVAVHMHVQLLNVTMRYLAVITGIQSTPCHQLPGTSVSQLPPGPPGESLEGQGASWSAASYDCYSQLAPVW